MEDEHVKSLKATARRGALISVAAVSALALASCSAGQITQTSSQVAAVDGAEAATESNTVVVRDVTVHVDKEGQAGLKFVAVNQDNTNKDHNLRSVTVDGETVTLNGDTTIKSNCSLVADLQAELDRFPQAEAGCINYVATSLPNTGLAVGGNKDVTFNFDDGEINVVATISEPVYESGTVDRVVGERSHDSH
ncbi:hypothetical protein ACXM2N_10095 [Corynebacterium sp. ZY180755]